MKILSTTLIIGIVIVSAHCQTLFPPTEFGTMEPRHCQHLYNTLKHTSDSVDVFLDLVKSQKIQVANYEFEDYLRIASVINKELFKTMEYVYDHVVSLVNWKNPLTASKHVLKELEHIDNYSEAFKEELVKIRRQVMNSSDAFDGNHCQIMPIGPTRVINVVVQLPTRAEREAFAQRQRQYSNFDKISTHIQDAMEAKMQVSEVIQGMLGGFLYHELKDRAEIQKRIANLHKEFWDLMSQLLQMTESATNLVIDDNTVKKSKTLANLALTIRSTFIAFESD